MAKEHRHSPWLWIPSLCAAEEIPSAMVTYVALLMFVQLGVSNGMASLFVALLSLPWVLKSYLRSKVRNAGYFKIHIHVVEVLMFMALMGTALYFNYRVVNRYVLFGILFATAMLCAWHELLARMYYNRMLYPRQQRLYNGTRIFASQVTVVLTYGVLIIFAGFFEVFFRSMQKAWAMESYLLAGTFLLFTLVNFIVLKNPRIHNPYRYESLLHAFKNELHIVERIRRKPHSFAVILTSMALLLPQGLMFNTRVFFLLAPAENGGLDCSLQEVGFAQGTIGVIAYSLGIILGRILQRRVDVRKLHWPMAVILTSSPVFYMLMALWPQVGNIWLLCLMTSLAQFCFGFGLNVCMSYVHYISNERYRNTINYLYTPMVAGGMLVPMALSGWMVEALGFSTFFIIDALCAPLAWIVLWICSRKYNIA